MSPPHVFRYCQPSSPDEEAAAVELLREYLGWVLKLEPFAHEAPTFRDIEMDSARLSDDYRPPYGQFILATHRGVPAGCVALASPDAGSAELTRLFVRPEFRGQGLARSLVRQLVAQAHVTGYGRLYLESHVSMTAAHRIYEEEGFLAVDPPDAYPAYLRHAVICMQRSLP
jgi:putative acetyltransferase